MNGAWDNPTPVAVQLQAGIDLSADHPKVGLIVIDRSDGAGWALPAGYVESSDRSAEEAAVREFIEETRLITATGRLAWSKITEAKKLILFVHGVCGLTLNLSRWEPTTEAKAIRIATNPEELCFPTHTEAMRRWFEMRIGDEIQ